MGTAAQRLDVSDLRENELFAGLSHDQYLWLSEVGTHHMLTDGQVLFAEGDRATYFVVILEGELIITKTVEGREEVLTRHSTRANAEHHHDKPSAAHRFTGEMPLLADDVYMATATSVGTTRVGLYSKSAFLEMLVRCPPVCQVLLPVLAWRVRASEAEAGQRRTVNGLGTLAAGLAHELNNPAAAVARAAGELLSTASRLGELAESWGGVSEPTERRALHAARAEVARRPPHQGRSNTLEAIDAEDAMAQWLGDRGVEEGFILADLLAERGFDLC